MAAASSSRSAKIRERLDHPVIDTDGHMLELSPVFFDYVREIGGSGAVDKYLESGSTQSELIRGQGMWHSMSDEQRRDVWMSRPTFWNFPTTNTLDRATVSLAKLLYERMDEFGMDFAVLYPTMGFSVTGFEDEEMRRVACRAFNTFVADHYRGYADRITPVAVIPVQTPQEAIEEMEYAVKVLGLKAVMFSLVHRPIRKVLREYPEAAPWATRLDTLAFESEYDYDPLWAKCVELKVAAASHASGIGWASRRSINNYMYNHIGSFAAAGDAFCKAVFMGGVTRRFPTLKFAFLEGGVGWACNLYADLVGHWEKRNPKALRANLDPARLDRQRMLGLVERYGEGRFVRKLGELRELFARTDPMPEALDEWAPCQIEKAEDIRDLFVRNFYFGCEADDPINAWAFNTKVNPFGARLKAMFSSDIGHWDVPDMNEVVEEAYELVEKSLLTEEDFRDFMFTNPATLYLGMNPDFFKGTRVEPYAAKLLATMTPAG